MGTAPPSSLRTSSGFWEMDVDNSAVEQRKRRSRCGKCDACNRSDCGACGPCKSMVKFGGDGTRKEACIHRRCLYLRGPPTRVIEEEDDEVVNVPRTYRHRSPGISEEKEEAEPYSPEPQQEEEPDKVESPQRQQEEEAVLLSPYEKKNNLESDVPLFGLLRGFLDNAGSNNHCFSIQVRSQLQRYTCAIQKKGIVFRENWLRAEEECEGLGVLSPSYLLLLCLSSDSFARADISTLRLLCKEFKLHEVVMEAANEWGLTFVCPLEDSNVLISSSKKKLLKCVVFVSRFYHAARVLQYSPKPDDLRILERVLQEANTMLENDRKRKSPARLEDQLKKKKKKKKSHISGRHSPEQVLATVTNAPTFRSEDAKLPAGPRNGLQGENGKQAREPAAANTVPEATNQGLAQRPPTSPTEDAKPPARPRDTLQGQNGIQGRISEPTAHTPAAANTVPEATNQGLAQRPPQAPQAKASAGQGSPSQTTIRGALQKYGSWLGQEEQRHSTHISRLKQKKGHHEAEIARLDREKDQHVAAILRLEGEVSQENNFHQEKTKKLKEKRDNLKLCEQDFLECLQGEE